MCFRSLSIKKFFDIYCTPDYLTLIEFNKIFSHHLSYV